MRVVHIGFPKTGTTFLQREVFPRLRPEWLYFDSQDSEAAFAPLIHHDDTIFDADGLKHRFEDAWRSRARVLFSYEPLTGLHHQTGFVNRTPIAKRLRALGFNRVIITIRNQFEVLESAYKQYVKSGGVLDFDEYVSFGPGPRRGVYPEYFDYYSIYRLYAETFRPENVLVLQYEHLAAGTFVAGLCRFLGVAAFKIRSCPRVNASLSYKKTKILRLLNHFISSPHRPSRLVPKRLSAGFVHDRLARLPLLERRQSFLTDESRAEIAAFYRASNEALRRSAGVPLEPDYP
jgi:hypothetical protein